MKKILAKIFGATGSNIAEKISDIIDKHTFSKVEKAQFEKEMQEIFIKAESDIQQSITERWKIDLNSDSVQFDNISDTFEVAQPGFGVFYSSFLSEI